MNTKGKAIRLSKMQFFKINELCMMQWRGIYFQHQISSGLQIYLGKYFIDFHQPEHSEDLQ